MRLRFNTLLAVALSLALQTIGSPVLAQTAERSASAQRSEGVVRKFWDAFNRRAWSELDDLVTPTYAHHPPGKTLDLAQFKRGGEWVHRGLANYVLSIEASVATETAVAIRWTATGTHVGSFFGEAPTNREVKVQGMHFHALTGGRISEDWEVIDFDGFKAQLRGP